MRSSIKPTALLLLALSSAVPAFAASHLQGPIVERLHGRAIVSDRVAAGDRRVLHVGDQIPVGEYVRTSAETNVVLVFADGERVTLRPNTILKVGNAGPGTRIERDWSALLIPPRNRELFLRTPATPTR